MSSDESAETIRYMEEEDGGPPTPPPSRAPAATPPLPPPPAGTGGARRRRRKRRRKGPALVAAPLEGEEEDPHLLHRREEISQWTSLYSVYVAVYNYNPCTAGLCLFSMVGLANYAFKIAYYAFEQCSKIKPIMLRNSNYAGW